MEEVYRSIYTKVVKAGKRLYFIDVKDLEVKDLDYKLYYIIITESVKKNKEIDGDKIDGEDKKQEFVKFKIKLLPEDFNKFMSALGDVINHIKTELMPKFDYDKYN